MEDYLPRIVDKSLELKLRAFGATNIVGPKWCGKTTTAKQYTNSCIQFQKDPNTEGLIKTAAINPRALLEGLNQDLSTNGRTLQIFGMLSGHIVMNIKGKDTLS